MCPSRRRDDFGSFYRGSVVCLLLLCLGRVALAQVSFLVDVPVGTYRSHRSDDVATADLDGDGAVDAATLDSQSPQISVLRGNGDGTFQPPVTFAAGINPVFVVAADLDGDGVPDLATADSWGTTTVRFNLRAAIAEAAIDIKPGSDLNPINPGSRGVIPVAVLGSETFDVSTVDITSLTFGPRGAAPAHSNGGRLGREPRWIRRPRVPLSHTRHGHCLWRHGGVRHGRAARRNPLRGLRRHPNGARLRDRLRAGAAAAAARLGLQPA